MYQIDFFFFFQFVTISDKWNKKREKQINQVTLHERFKKKKKLA